MTDWLRDGAERRGKGDSMSLAGGGAYSAYMSGNQTGRSGLIGPSGVTGCYRQHAFKYLDVEPTDVVPVGAADLGTLLHLGWTTIIKGTFTPEDRDADVLIDWGGPRPGSADDVDYVNRIVSDLKSVNARNLQYWLNNGVSDSYWDQLTCYAHGLTAMHGGGWEMRIIALPVEDGDGFQRGVPVEFTMPYDPQHGAELVALANERHAALMDVRSLLGTVTDDALSLVEQFPREGKGPGRFPCDWCCAPGTKVLRPDFTWVDIADVRVGDVLLGRDEYPGRSGKAKLRRTVVTKTHRRTADRVVVNGSLTVAATKKFWVRSEWLPVTQVVGRAAQFVAAPVDEDAAMYERGWLAGMADGDGSFWWANGEHRHRHFRIALSVDADLLLDTFMERAARAGFVLTDGWHRSGVDNRRTRALRLMKHKECARFEQWVEEDVDHPSWHWGYLAGMADAEGCITGKDGSIRISQYPEANPREYARIGASLDAVGVRATAEPKGYYISAASGGLWKFLSGAHPLRPVFTGLAVDRVPHYSRKVESVTETERGEVVSIQTDSGTYIAEGWVVHNCPFVSACWPDAREGMSPQSETVVDDPEAVGRWASQYMAASAEESAAKRRKSEASAFLRGIGGTFPTPDGARVKVTVVGGSAKRVPDIDAIREQWRGDLPMKEQRSASYPRVTRLR